MATYPQHTVHDPRFINDETITEIHNAVKERLSKIAPSEIDHVARKDVVAMMYRVWRYHATVDYMIRVTIDILVQNVLSDRQIELTNINNTIHNSIPRVIHDPRLPMKASYKYPSSGIASRPVISLTY